MPPRRSSASPSRTGSADSPRRDSYAARLAALRAAAPAAPTAPRSGDTYAERSGLTSGESHYSRVETNSTRSGSSSRGSVSYAEPCAAPTPYNTYIEPSSDYDPTASQTASVFVGGPTASFVSEDYSPQDYTPRDSRPPPPMVSVSPSSSRRQSNFDDVPHSSKRVPAPPQQLRSTVSNDGSELFPVMSPDTTRRSVTSLEPGGQPPGRIKGFLSRRSSKTVIDRDTLRLQQLGYDAVLGRSFTFWSSLSMAWCNINSVQGTIFAVPGAYKFGGPAMMLVAWPVSFVLSMCLVSTMSELASAYPVAGAMSSWAWKLTRNGIGGERYWGWVIGAFVLGGHIGNLVLVAWQNTTLIVGTMDLAFGFHAEDWHRFLLMLAMVVVVGAWGSTHLGSGARYWKCAGLFTFGAWLTLCIGLLAKGISHREYSKAAPAISTHFYNRTGFSARGLVYILGWQNCTIATGSDVSAHMSEETQNPSRNVPNAMTMSIVCTYLLGYISIILLFISVQPSEAAIIAAQDFPVGHIIQSAVSPNFSIAMCSIMAIVLCIQLQAQLQASSRFAFALARDHAMPFSDIIKRTNKYKQPWVATLLCIGLWAPWCLLWFAHRESVVPVITACASSLSMLSYVLPVLLYLFSKKDLQQEGRTSWSLRRWSRPVAVVGALFSSTVIVVQIFPSRYPVTVNTVSWTPVVVAGTLLICLFTWKSYGVRHYSGPIRALTKWETGVELDLDSTLQMSTQRDNHPSDRGNGTTSIKFTPVSFPTDPDNTRHTVSVMSARTESVASGGEWAAAPFSTATQDGDIARDLGISFSSGSHGTRSSNGATSGSRSSGPTVSFALGPTMSMGRVPEVDEEDESRNSSGGERRGAAD